MKFSVIIPVYNRAGTIRRALESVLNQTYPAQEIIVVDDASTDQTAEILYSYLPKIRIIRFPENRGVSAARNAGIHHAQGEWIAFLDSDYQWLPQKLEMAVEFHRSHPDLLIFQSEEIWMRKGRRVNPAKKHRKLAGQIFKPSLALCLISPSAVVVHRSLFTLLGAFDESLPVCEDYDLWLRITRHFPVGLDQRFGIVKYGGHKDQLSRKYWGMDRFRIQAMEKQLNDPSLPTEMRVWVLEELIKKTEILITGGKKRGKDVTELESKLDRFRRLYADSRHTTGLSEKPTQ